MSKDKINVDPPSSGSLTKAVEAVTPPITFDQFCQKMFEFFGEDSVFCKKLLTLIELEDVGGPENLKLTEICAALENVVNNTANIVGIETSLGQMGCTEDVDGNITGSVLVCKHTLPDLTQEIKVWWFGLDGSIIEDFEGEYVACTNLQSLKNCLDKILEKTATPFNIWGSRIDLNTIDNHSIGDPRPLGLGIVAWPIDTHDVYLTLSNGSKCVASWASTVSGDWPGHVDNLSSGITTCLNKEWGRLSLPADGNPNTPYGNHASTKCCPGDVYVVSAYAVVTSEARNGRTIPLATNYIKGEVVKYKQICCAGVDQWFEFGSVTPLASAPDLSCASVNCSFPETAVVQVDEPSCRNKTFGPLSDCLFSADPDVDPETLSSDIYVDRETCDGVTTIVVYTLDSEGRPEEYTVQGELANPDKSLFVAESECPDVNWQITQIQRKLNILDNSLWDNAPATHIGIGDFPATDIEVLWTDGTTSVFNWPGGRNLYGGFRAWLIEQTGCVYFDAIANWSKFDTVLPWGLTDADVPRECLFARGFSLMCCVGSKCIDTATVILSDNLDWVGATKKACTYTGPLETVFVGHVGCDAVYKDCEGKMLELPSGCCPIIPSNGLDQFKIIKDIGLSDADYNGAFQYINGRPDTVSTRELIDNRDPTNPVVVASGDDLESFIADLESKGYTEWSTGEQHWICPCPPGLTSESTGAYFTTVNGETSTKLVCVALTEIADAPTTKIVDTTVFCALQIIGCNDDRRDELLQSNCDKLTLLVDSLTGDCPTKVLTAITSSKAILVGNLLGTFVSNRSIEFTDDAGTSVGTAIASTPVYDEKTNSTSVALTQNTVSEKLYSSATKVILKEVVVSAEKEVIQEGSK